MLAVQRYLPYGEEWYDYPVGSELPTDRTFTGYLEVGPATERFPLFQAGARFYSGAFARFLSPDPLGPVVGDPRTLNPYSYAANNPLTYTDPTGMIFMDAGGGGSDLMRAIGVVGQGEPYPYPTYLNCGSRCANANDAWFFRTWSAVDYLSASGWDLNRLPWSPDQRYLVQAIAGSRGDTSVKSGVKAPTLDEVITYLKDGAPVPVIIAVAGIRANAAQGKAFEQATGSWGKHVRIDSATGTAKYRMADDITDTRLFEDKSGRRIRNSNQMIDQFIEAESRGLTYTFRITPGATVSKLIQAMYRNGYIDMMRISH